MQARGLLGISSRSSQVWEDKLNPKVLLHDGHVSSDGGEILWYGEPYFQSGTITELPATGTVGGLVVLVHL